ncbi:MAG: hypothetical protein HFE98_04660 [Ruminiclostridium sp.]|nr:hypothetical protein [Ruminiclostridium sp.]MCI9466978.1 hypothetical protein [Ruminiclostridium sp.]
MKKWIVQNAEGQNDQRRQKTPGLRQKKWTKEGFLRIKTCFFPGKQKRREKLRQKVQDFLHKPGCFCRKYAGIICAKGVFHF